MKGKDLLLLTVKISLVIQLLTGVVSSGGIFIKLNDDDKVLHDVLIIESIVQLVEGLFYIYIAYAMKDIKEGDIASRRYFDWVITTPIMLVSTIMYMEYTSSKNIGESITTSKILKDNQSDLIKICFYNLGMLLFGYLGEINIIPKEIGVPIGFGFFGLSFYEIWDNFAYKTDKTRKLYYFLISIWGLYGVAAIMPIIPKNIMYNNLDIISKNFYGLFILYEVIKLKKQINK